MNPAVLDIDEQAGDLVSGYFFYLERFDPYDDVEVDCDGQILGIGDGKDSKRAVNATYVGSRRSKVFDCHVSCCDVIMSSSTNGMCGTNVCVPFRDMFPMRIATQARSLGCHVKAFQAEEIVTCA